MAVGALSRVVTAVAVLQLVERGKLDLTADIEDYCECDVLSTVGDARAHDHVNTEELDVVVTGEQLLLQMSGLDAKVRLNGCLRLLYGCLRLLSGCLRLINGCLLVLACSTADTSGLDAKWTNAVRLDHGRMSDSDEGSDEDEQFMSEKKKAAVARRRLVEARERERGGRKTDKQLRKIARAEKRHERKLERQAEAREKLKGYRFGPQPVLGALLGKVRTMLLLLFFVAGASFGSPAARSDVSPASASTSRRAYGRRA